MKTPLTASEGRIVDNFATTVLGNNDTVTRTITIPANRRWWVYGGLLFNADNVARNITVNIYNASAQRIGIIFPTQAVGAAGYVSYPNTLNSATQWAVCLLALKAGDYITITWTAGGASAGGSAISSCIAQEVIV